MEPSISKFDNNQGRDKRRETDRKKRLQIINDFAMILLHKTTIDEIVWLVAKSVIAKMGFLDCVVYLFDESGTKLIQKAAHGIKNPARQEILNPIEIKIGEGVAGVGCANGHSGANT